MWTKEAFTIIETVMVILVIGIIAIITIPRFIDLRLEANNARYEGCRGGMRSAVAMYYARTGLPEYEYLCNGPPENPERTSGPVPAPCYPASCTELQGLIISLGCDVDCSCYDAGTGLVVPCG